MPEFTETHQLGNRTEFRGSLSDRAYRPSCPSTRLPRPTAPSSDRSGRPHRALQVTARPPNGRAHLFDRVPCPAARRPPSQPCQPPPPEPSRPGRPGVPRWRRRRWRWAASAVTMVTPAGGHPVPALHSWPFSAAAVRCRPLPPARRPSLPVS